MNKEKRAQCIVIYYSKKKKKFFFEMYKTIIKRNLLRNWSAGAAGGQAVYGEMSNHVKKYRNSLKNSEDNRH